MALLTAVIKIQAYENDFWLSSKESNCSAGDLGLIPGLGRFPGEGNNNPLQYSCLGNLMDRGAWWATVHGVSKESDTTKQLSLQFTSFNLMSLEERKIRFRDTVCVCSVTSDSATPWTVAHQAPLSMRFPRQEYWSGLPLPSPKSK